MLPSAGPKPIAKDKPDKNGQDSISTISTVIQFVFVLYIAYRVVLVFQGAPERIAAMKKVKRSTVGVGSYSKAHKYQYEAEKIFWGGNKTAMENMHEVSSIKAKNQAFSDVRKSAQVKNDRTDTSQLKITKSTLSRELKDINGKLEKFNIALKQTQDELERVTAALSQSQDESKRATAALEQIQVEQKNTQNQLDMSEQIRKLTRRVAEQSEIVMLESQRKLEMVVKRLELYEGHNESTTADTSELPPLEGP